MTRILAVVSLALAACGGASPVWAGKWKQPAGVPPGSYMECTLGGSGTSIAGSGTQYREAGAPLTFTLKGSAAAASVDVTYQDALVEHFSFAQPDASHITLQNAQRTVSMVKQ